MRTQHTSSFAATALAMAALITVGCATAELRRASAVTTTTLADEPTERVSTVFALLARADGQRCRAMRDGLLACCATLLDGREACWPRAEDTVEWRPPATMRAEDPSPPDASTALLPSVSCAQTVDGRPGCCARGHDGALRCWTDERAIAHNDAPDGPRARVVEGLSRVRRITAGGRRTCALLEDGGVWCWGVNYDGRPAPRRGQPLAWRRRAWSPVAVRLRGIPAAVDIADGASVDTGGSLCAIAVDGAVWCVDASVWTHDGAPRGRVERIDAVRGATQLALGSNHGCALTRDGGVWCWGDGSYGQLGRGGFIASGDGRAARVPLAPAQQIAAGWNTTCALLRDASVWCWGSNFFGVVGDGTQNHADRPVRVSTLAPAAEIAVTHEHACARGEDGWVACWGSNSSAGPRSPVASGSVRDAVQLALGSFVSCALRRDGRASCWGALDLGDGARRWTAPTELAGLSGATRIAVGTSGGVAPTLARVCALTDEATIRCIGGAGTIGED